MSKELQIRNSTVDFLVFTRDAGEDGIEVRVQNGDVWLTQKAISQLFNVDRSVVTKHLSNIFKEGELDENSTCANFAQVADNGKTYNYKFYSLAAIIAVGYRISIPTFPVGLSELYPTIPMLSIGFKKTFSLIFLFPVSYNRFIE